MNYYQLTHFVADLTEMIGQLPRWSSRRSKWQFFLDTEPQGKHE